MAKEAGGIGGKAQGCVVKTTMREFCEKCGAKTKLVEDRRLQYGFGYLIFNKCSAGCDNERMEKMFVDWLEKRPKVDNSKK